MFKLIFSILLTSIIITSCTRHTSKLNVLPNSPFSVELFEYKGLYAKAPDSLSHLLPVLNQMMEMDNNNTKNYTLVSENKLVELVFSTDSILQSRTIYSLQSDSIIQFTYGIDGNYFELIDPKIGTRNFSLLPESTAEDKEIHRITETNKSLEHPKLTQYKITYNENLSYEIWLDQSLPIQYFGNLKIPKGYPTKSKMNMPKGFSMIHGLHEISTDIQKFAHYFNTETTGYKNINKIKQDGILNSDLFGEYENPTIYQVSHLSIKEDTLLFYPTTCYSVSDFKLSISPNDLSIKYIIPERQDTTNENSRGELFDLGKINNRISTAKYKDQYSDQYLIFKNNDSNSEIFGQIWRTRRKSSYLIQLFAESCISVEDYKSIVTEIIKKERRIEIPVVYIGSNSEIQASPTLLRISEYGYSKAY